MDMTLRTPIPPALTGRLACRHCSSVMLTFVIILRVIRRLLSMLDSNVWPAHGDERMTSMSFGALHEARRSTSASWAEMSCRRSDALFSSSSFFSRAESIAEPGTKGAPSSVALLIVQWENWPIGSDVKAFNLLICSHLIKFKSSPIVAPIVLICLTSLVTNGSGPPMVMSSIKPMVKGLSSSRSMGWIVKQNSNGPNGSPCLMPSCERICLLPNLSTLSLLYDNKQNE